MPKSLFNLRFEIYNCDIHKEGKLNQEQMKVSASSSAQGLQ